MIFNIEENTMDVSNLPVIILWPVSPSRCDAFISVKEALKSCPGFNKKKKLTERSKILRVIHLSQKQRWFFQQLAK